jgi:hypothetical protein
LPIFPNDWVWDFQFLKKSSNRKIHSLHSVLSCHWSRKKACCPVIGVVRKPAVQLYKLRFKMIHIDEEQEHLREKQSRYTKRHGGQVPSGSIIAQEQREIDKKEQGESQ